MRNARGFTLIELMIVVSIIAVLASLAIPQYQDYVLRSRWSDNVLQIGRLKQAIAECTQFNNGTLVLGACDTIPNLTASEFLTSDYATPSNANTRYLGAPVVVVGGVITLVGNAMAGNCVVTISPTFPAGSTAIRWNAVTSPLAGCSRAKTGLGD